MNYNTLLGMLLALISASCNPFGHEHINHDEQDEITFQYTSYTANFELFAEAEAFVVGKSSNVLSHFSHLPDFKAVEQGAITIVLTINSKEIRQKLDKPTRKGIYSFDIIPEIAGTGDLKFEISNENGNFVVDVPGVTVFSEMETAADAASKLLVSETNATYFTKEQSWKVDFATDFPLTKPFGQVIKSTALVQSAQGNELVIAAKTNGIVTFTSDALFEGFNVNTGQPLFKISSGNFADHNIAVKYAEAKSNFEKANSDYNRAKELAEDKIVSDKDLLTARNQYEIAKAVFDNLNKNFNASGQTITSPQTGFIKQVFVKNGTYVDAGQPLAVVSQNKSLILLAEVPSRFASVLTNIKTANIRTITDHRIFSIEELNGRVLSYGKAANSDNYMIPVTLQIENNGSFVGGGFVEVYLKTFSNTSATVVPKTALLEEQGNFFVWVQIHPELFEKREVFVGGTDGIHTEIQKGITSNDRIVTRGAMLIKLAQAAGALDAHSGHVH